MLGMTLAYWSALWSRVLAAAHPAEPWGELACVVSGEMPAFVATAQTGSRSIRIVTRELPRQRETSQVCSWVQAGYAHSLQEQVVVAYPDALDARWVERTLVRWVRAPACVACGVVISGRAYGSQNAPMHNKCQRRAREEANYSR
jgi:hypothetical protein